MRQHLSLWKYLLCLTSFTLWGQGCIIIEPPHYHHPVVRHQPLELKSLNVDVNLSERMAVTQIEQVFYNPSSRMQQGSFVFPLPSGAHIESFTMMINGVETKAELLNASKAKGIYEEIVRKMRDPALLEFSGGSMLRLRVFPVEAHAQKKVTISYRQILNEDAGLIHYQYPLRACQFTSDTIGQFSFKGSFNGNSPLKTAYAPSLQLDILREQQKFNTQRTHFQPKQNIDIFYSFDNSALGMSGSTHRIGKDGYFWLSLTPQIDTQDYQAKDLAIVVDTSGSMAGEKLDRVREALNFCLASLNKKDRFEVIRFSTEAESFAGDWVSAKQRKQAQAFVKDFEAIGGTNIADALALVSALPVDPKRPQLVLFLTDGKPTIGERDQEALLAKIDPKQQRRYFSFGIGDEINTHLLDKLAAKTGGWRTYASPNEDIEVKLSSLYSKIKAPALVNPKLDISGIRVSEVYPQQLNDLFSGLPVHIFGRYQGHGDAKISLSGSYAGKPKNFTYQFNFPKHNSDHSFIPQLWAQRRVGFLLDQIRLNGHDTELENEIKRLAKKHGIITPFTSYLIVEDNESIPRVSAASSQRAQKAMKSKSGADSVTASRMIQKMGKAESLDAMPQEEMAFAPTTPQKETASKHKTSTKKYAMGRAFYLKDGSYRDASLKEDSKAAKKIAFASKAYFQLLQDHPELKQILALGTQLHFQHQGIVYKIHDS